MEMKRAPLKLLYSGNESPRRTRLATVKVEAENVDPEASSNGGRTSLLRLTELEVKPDTPIIPSVRSRIQMMEGTSRTDGAQGVREESLSYIEGEKSVSGMLDPAAEEAAEPLAGLSPCDWALEERVLAVTHSTLRSSHEEVEPPSTETASRLRQERQEELAMLCTVIDRSNPWRAASMRRPQKRTLDPASQDLSGGKRRRRVRVGRGSVKMGPVLDSDSSGSECVELSLEGNDGSGELSDDRYVSSLEVRLRRSCDSDSLTPEDPPSFICEAADSGSPAGVMADGHHVTLNSSELIDRIFEGVLNGSAAAEDLEAPDEELLPISVLSPLTKSLDLQAALGPLVSPAPTAFSVVSSLPELLEETPEVSPEVSGCEDHLPYSVDAYRTLRRNVHEAPAIQKPAPKRQRVDRAPVDVKEKIKILSKEVSSLQRIIEQSCCALSYCVDAEHGKGTRQEAEAERLLLLSCEKKAALLKELDRLRDGRSEEPPSSPECDLTPCSGSVTISDIRLPLKVDYVCSTILETGPAGHYFLLLIRYGAYDVVATPLASTTDAHTGDTITFPTSITLKDTSADFRVEFEVYSLAQSGYVLDKRTSLRPKITPKKLLSSRKTSVNSPACSPAVNAPLRSSSFLLVGSLTVTLESFSKYKFPLEKVPFLSPLEGSLYLKLQCQSHSHVQRSGFLTMFEDVGGLAAWHRRWCMLSGNSLSFWAYPDQESCKEPLGRINLMNCTSTKVEPAKRESCARPHTLELVTMRPQREDDVDTLVIQCRNMLCFTKSWLSADTKEDGRLWMDALNQALLDIGTWKTSPVNVTTSGQEQLPRAQPCAR
ncbi:anillin-like isoform X2 [Ranitomeya imitator]|uniref:anillin-like isoform X2 n=1 Tax=Ranitomeya imitator TaxID=111125 RepID=UPI0037E77B2A